MYSQVSTPFIAAIYKSLKRTVLINGFNLSEK